MSYTLPNQPCTTMQIFKESARLYKEIFKPLIPLNILFCLFFLAFLWTLSRISIPPMAYTPIHSLSMFTSVMKSLIKSVHWFPMLPFFIVGMMNLLLFASILAGTQKWILGQKIFYKESFSLAASRLPFYLITKMLVYFFIALGCMLFFVPGIMLYVCFGFILPSILFDRTHVFTSLGHSFKLTFDWDRWWQSLAILLSGFVPTSLLTIALYHFFGQHLLFLASTPYTLAIAIAARLIQALFLFFITPWITSTLVVQYYNLKNSVRMEETRVQFFKEPKKAASFTP